MSRGLKNCSTERAHQVGRASGSDEMKPAMVPNRWMRRSRTCRSTRWWSQVKPEDDRGAMLWSNSGCCRSRSVSAERKRDVGPRGREGQEPRARLRARKTGRSTVTLTFGGPRRERCGVSSSRRGRQASSDTKMRRYGGRAKEARGRECRESVRRLQQSLSMARPSRQCRQSHADAAGSHSPCRKEKEKKKLPCSFESKKKKAWRCERRKKKNSR